MTPNSPTARRGPAGRLLAAVSAAAAAAALTCSAVFPAFADTVPPLAPGNADSPAASARIAYVDWCDRGAVGEVGTAGSGDPAATRADWNADPHEVATGRHFAAAPDDAYSSVSRDGERLTAAAGLTDVRFSPECRNGPDSSSGIPVAAAFDRDALLVLDSVAANAWWSPDSGPRAEISVHGLEILGEPADMSDGDYTRTFSTDTGKGDITVAVSAERGVSQPDRHRSDGRPAAHGDSAVQRAAAWLSVSFEVARVDEEGRPISGFEYAVEFAGAAVRAPADAPAPRESPSPDDGGAPAPTATAPDGSGPADGSGGGAQGGSGGSDDESGGSGADEAEDRPGQAAPTGGPTGGEAPDGAAPPVNGGSSAGGQNPPSDDGSGGAEEAPTQKDPAPGPTVAAPTDPDEAPSVDPGGGTDSDGDESGGRLPVAGSALVGLVVTGLAALGGGGTAVYLGRGRKSGFDGDDIDAYRNRESRGADDWS